MIEITSVAERTEYDLHMDEEFKVRWVVTVPIARNGEKVNDEIPMYHWCLENIDQFSLNYIGKFIEAIFGFSNETDAMLFYLWVK